MITWRDLYNVLSKVVPLYVVMILAYISVKLWKIFTPDDCLRINRFVTLFAVPSISIDYIANNNPYTMDYSFILADTLQKAIVIVTLYLWYKISSKASLEWCTTLFSLITLTNTLIMGIPLLGGMYGETPCDSLMVQLSVLQFIVWYPGLLFFYEYRKSTLLNSRSCLDDEKPDKCSTKETLDQPSGNCGFDEETEVCLDIQSGSTEVPAECGNNVVDNDHDRRGNRRLSKELTTIDSTTLSTLGSRPTDDIQPETAAYREPKSTKPPRVTAIFILFVVCKKLIKNPNFFISIIALVWSLIAFRLHVVMPAIVSNSIKILSDAGLGMAMFSLGLFMASQPRIIAGGNASAALSTVMRFVVGPSIIIATSIAVGLKGTLLQISIMQASLPQAVVPFIFAQEYNVHAAILSTAVSFGMLISLPITILYYIVLGLIIKQ